MKSTQIEKPTSLYPKNKIKSPHNEYNLEKK